MPLVNFPLLLLALLFPTAVFRGRSLAAADAPGLITETCKHTMHFDICMSTLQSSPRSVNADLKVLVSVSIDASLAYAVETAALMRKLKYDARRANQKEMWRCLRDCLDGYDEATYDVEQAAVALTHGALDTVNMMMAGATANADTCEAGFEESRWLRSPVTERNAHLMKLCSNSMAIAKLLG